MSLVGCTQLIDCPCNSGTLKFILGFSGALVHTEHLAEACAVFMKTAFIDLLNEYKPAKFAKDLPVHGTPLSLARVRAFHTSDSIHGHTGVVLLEMSGSGLVASEFRRGIPLVTPWGIGCPSCPQCAMSLLVQPSLEKDSNMHFKCRCGTRTRTIPIPSTVVRVPLDFLGKSHYIFPFPHPVWKMTIEWMIPDGSLVTTLWDGTVSP